MKLAFIRQRYNPYGGAERFVSRSLQALSGERLSITVFAREWRDGGAARVERCDPFYLGRLWRDWSFSRAVCARLAERRFDLVQSHERIACCDVFRAGDGVHAQWLQNRARSLPGMARLALLLNPYHRYTLAAERRLFASPRLRAVICNSRMVAAEIRRWFGLPEEKLHVVYNGVDLETFHPGLRARHRADGRRRLGLADSVPVLLFVGSGYERKGLPQLLRALPALPAAHLVVVGKDKKEAGMRAICGELGLGERVHFAGPQDDVRSWYGLADCFALPTLYDPFPNAALEAMACALPVITSSACGAAELIESGRNGYICEDPLSVDQLARSAAACLQQATVLGEAARRTAEQYGLARMAAQLRSLYGRLLSVPEESGGDRPE